MQDMQQLLTTRITNYKHNQNVYYPYTFTQINTSIKSRKSIRKCKCLNVDQLRRDIRSFI